MVEPSRLDSVLQHMERCCVLWRKRRRTEGVQAMQDDEPEAKDADEFVEVVTPRALRVLLALAKQNLGFVCGRVIFLFYFFRSFSLILCRCGEDDND